MAATTFEIGISPFEGKYPIDLAAQLFSPFEWRIIKRISGYMPMTWEEGLAGGDPDLICALALIAMLRSGRIQKDEVFEVARVFEDPPFDGVAISVSFDGDGAGDADPPQFSSTDGEMQSGGDGSSESLEPSPETIQSASGIPDSDTGSTSDRLTLAT